MSSPAGRLGGLVVVGLAIALATWSLLESRAAAEATGGMEIELRQARAAAERQLQANRERGAAALARAADEAQARQREIARLERALDAALEHSRAIGAALTAEVEEREREAVERAAQQALVTLPVPLGVRRCIDAFRHCAQTEGFGAMRIMRATGLEDGELLGVEFLSDAEDPASATVTVAARMSAELDRAEGRLVLRFFDGFRRGRGVRVPLPEAGYELTLVPVDSVMWEQRLPYFVRATGSLPEKVPDSAAAPPTVDALTRAMWLERLDELLRTSGAAVRLRVSGFRDLADGRFLQARVHGYDQNKLLALTADCEDLAVEVDDAAGVVSMLLRNGTLRRNGSESTIGAEGFRMMLPDVTPEQATAAMMGMVVRK